MKTIVKADFCPGGLLSKETFFPSELLSKETFVRVNTYPKMYKDICLSKDTFVHKYRTNASANIL